MAWDDIKASHIDSRENDDFEEWLNSKYTNNKLGQIKVTRGKRHYNLGMLLDYTEEYKLKEGVTDYIDAMIDEFDQKVNQFTSTVWRNYLKSILNNQN